jgi:hypothetical protein
MSDIYVQSDKPWLVIGWFTPDYRPLAEKLANNLDFHGAPYRLFAREKAEHGWDPRQKPSVVMHAMQRHPGKTLVLMDVDCIVAGNIEPVMNIEGDVGLSVKARQKHRKRGGQQPIVLMISSRVVVFRPTPKAWEFVVEWERLCQETRAIDDETALGWAYIRKPLVATQQLDQRYVGLEIGALGTPPGVVIWHESAHDPQKRSAWRNVLKNLERRYLRTGRTRAMGLQRIG